jgi:hypothetical protein
VREYGCARHFLIDARAFIPFQNGLYLVRNVCIIQNLGALPSKSCRLAGLEGLKVIIGHKYERREKP